MFYILFHHSTIVKINKLFYTLLYGSLLYLAIHIIMMFSDIESLKIFKDNYFWTILSIDLCTFLYLFISGSTLSTNGIVEGNNNEINSILKPFKDEINKVLNQNNEIKMTKQEPVISFPSNNEKIVMESEINTNQNVNINQNTNTNQNVNNPVSDNNNSISNQTNNNVNNDSSSSGNYSTPINRLNKNNNQPVVTNNQPVVTNNQPVINNINSQSNSTNVTDLRNRLASQVQDMKPEGFTRIDSQNNNPNNNFNNSNQNINNFNQNMSTPIKKDLNYKSDTISVADSDIGSTLDLDLNDFENSIN